MASKYNVQSTADQLVKDYAPIVAGKVILTTGVSPDGLGAHYLKHVSVGKPKLLILAGRSMTKLEATQKALEPTGVLTKLLELDNSSFSSVRKAAETVNSWVDVPYIDVLVNNAGIMGVDYGTTVDGFENQLGINHLGPFLFTNLIMDKIMKAEAPRVVMVSSTGHRFGPIRFGDYNFQKGETYNRWLAYGQSKTANMLMARSLAAKLGSKGLVAVSLHPGFIWTKLTSHLDIPNAVEENLQTDIQFGNAEAWAPDQLKTPEQGVATHVFASFEPELKDHNGTYLLDAHVADPFRDQYKAWANHPVEAELLWRLSEKLVGTEFKY